MVAQKCPEHQPPKSGRKLEGHHLLPWKKTGQMMDPVQVEEPKVLSVGKGDLSLEPSLSAQKLMTVTVAMAAALLCLLLARPWLSNFGTGLCLLLITLLWSCCACVFSDSVMSRPLQTSWTVAHQFPLSMEFSRQKYWSGLPFPPPGDPPNSKIKPTSPASPALQFLFFFFTTEPLGKPS